MAKSADAFRTISEVAEWLDTPAHVLRFWESKFTQVKPVKRAGGRRYYRPADMELLGGIKHLLHEEGMTIKGVQKLLRDRGAAHVAGLSRPLGDDDAPAAFDVEQSEQPPATVLPFRGGESAAPAAPAREPAPVAEEPDDGDAIPDYEPPEYSGEAEPSETAAERAERMPPMPPMPPSDHWEEDDGADQRSFDLSAVKERAEAMEARRAPSPETDTLSNRADAEALDETGGDAAAAADTRDDGESSGFDVPAKVETEADGTIQDEPVSADMAPVDPEPELHDDTTPGASDLTPEPPAEAPAETALEPVEPTPEPTPVAEIAAPLPEDTPVPAPAASTDLPETDPAEPATQDLPEGPLAVIASRRPPLSPEGAAKIAPLLQQLADWARSRRPM
nr:MerR family transcriptional regulator [Oceanicola sp. 22II-s10i]